MEFAMTTTKRKILVTGATGQIGGELIRILASDDSLDIVAAARNPAKAQSLGVPVVYFDYDRVETMAPALEGVDSVFMLTGYTVDMLKQSYALINAAKKAGVKHIVHLGAPGNDNTASRTRAGTSSSSASSNGRASRSPICVPKSSCRTCWATADPKPSATAPSATISATPASAGLMSATWPPSPPWPCSIRPNTPAKPITSATTPRPNRKSPPSSARWSANHSLTTPARRRNSSTPCWPPAPTSPT